MKIIREKKICLECGGEFITCKKIKVYCSIRCSRLRAVKNFQKTEYGKIQTRIQSKKYYYKNKDKKKEYSKKYNSIQKNKRKSIDAVIRHRERNWDNPEFRNKYLIRCKDRKKRKDILRQHQDKCDICSSNENLQLHHEDYNNPEKIKVLCIKCHRLIHQLKNKQL